MEVRKTTLKEKIIGGISWALIIALIIYLLSK